MVAVDQLPGQPNETGARRADTMAPMTGPNPAAPSGPDWHVVSLRLDGVSDRAGFLDRCARDLELPDWFGHNWDALADCLIDLSWWGESGGYLLHIRGWEAFRAAAPEAAAIAADVLADAVAYWSARGTPLTVHYDEDDA